MDATRNNPPGLFWTARVAELCPATAITVLALAMAAGSPEAAGNLGEIAATLAAYALLLPSLARRLYDFVPPEAGNPQATALTLFLAGAGLALAQSLESTSPRAPVTAAFFLLIAALAGRLYVRAWLADSTALPIWSLTRFSVGAMALAALAGAADSIGHLCGLLRSPWLAAGVTDGVLLAVAFHATAVAAADRDREQAILRLPGHWPEMVTLAHLGAAATVAVQAWVTRYPGARATALLIVTGAPLFIAAALLLADALRLRPAGGARPPSRAAAPILLLLAYGAFLAGAALSNLRAVNAALIGQDAAIWPWGWRLPLALAAAAAYSGQWERTILRPGL
ncbi:MAG: hypothetical protein N2512_11195, partial [Armatimonadetes bacterium]|nr:hypothetical protein [Armatimonadota bacterium]